MTFLDDDDVIEETKIEKQVACLEALVHSWGMCYTGYRVIKEHGDDQISSEKRSGNCYVDALMRTMFMGSGSNLSLRKSVVDEINGYDESFQRNQDIEFLVRACELYKLAYIDEVLLTIYQEGNRAVRSFEQIDGYTVSNIRGNVDLVDSPNSFAPLDSHDLSQKIMRKLTDLSNKTRKSRLDSQFEIRNVNNKIRSIYASITFH